MLDHSGSIDGIAATAKSASAPARQRTLKTSISCKGVGLHSGNSITMILRPGAPNSGIVFRRTDIAGAGALIPAHWASVNDTRMNTCVASEAGVSVRTIEHLMAAFAGMQIDNALVDINGPEVPVMDGSASPFVFLIECAGVVEQSAPRRAIRILRRVVVEEGDKLAALSPSPRGFSVRFEIDFADPAISRQECAIAIGNGTFKNEISRARTFGFETEVTALRAAGLARGGSLDNAVVIGNGRVLNKDGLRFQDEFVRHKVLDCVGDLYLAGAPVLGRVRCIRSGHRHNNIALRALFEQQDAWRYVDMPVVQPVGRVSHADLRVAAGD
jgi:UDP-3-O-[3-hydroxymyristoyl] N-acetylglucosamine deacetylase